MIKVKVSDRKDSTLFYTAEDFNERAFPGKLSVDCRGNAYVSTNITLSINTSGTHDVTLVDLSTGYVTPAEHLDPAIWPLRRLTDDESITLKNGE